MANTLAYEDAESIALVKILKGLSPGIAQKTCYARVFVNISLFHPSPIFAGMSLP